jgi:uncharacterized protein YndB with AHSA1/START domain
VATRNDSNELRLTRVYDAPVRAVWDAWTIPEQVEKWWGPRGFTLTTHSKDLRVGGSWRYTMHGPDGTDYPNVTKYHVVEPYQKLVYDHGGTDDRPPLFRVTVTFSEANGKTTMEMIMALPSPEAAADTAKFIKKAGGTATWDRLAEHLGEAATGKPSFVINRTFAAPIARLFERWTSPEHLAKWLSPAGTAMRFLRSEIAPGKSTFFVITGEHGEMHVVAEYLAIEPPRRVVYDQRFVDGQERPAPAPGKEIWPATLRTTVLLTEEAPDRTRVTVTSEPLGQTTAAEVDAFVRERPGMTVGWTGSFDELEALIDSDDASAQRYFHGTKADLRPGDLIASGRSSNYGKRKQAAYVYLTATLDAATWGAELAVGEGRGRIYVVEPTGPIEDDPNLTDKKFPGNPTKSYRTRDPLRVTGEITDWQGHPPEQLRAMKDHLARLAAEGIEAIED